LVISVGHPGLYGGRGSLGQSKLATDLPESAGTHPDLPILHVLGSMGLGDCANRGAKWPNHRSLPAAENAILSH